MNGNRNSFWEAHRGIVWSNPAAGDAVHIRGALIRPHFATLLDIAVAFGVERLRTEWKILMGENTREASKAARAVSRILDNIEKGRALAASRN
jgi:hypothetical protein